MTWLEQRTNNRSHKNHTVAEYYTYCTQIEGEGEEKILQTETPGQNGSFCTFGMIKNMPQQWNVVGVNTWLFMC